MKKVTYHWDQGYCGDGCCSWDESTIEVRDENGNWLGEYEEVGTFFDVSDLEDWMKGYFGENWKETYTIEVDKCSFY